MRGLLQPQSVNPPQKINTGNIKSRIAGQIISFETRFPFRPHPSPLPSTGEGTVDGSSPAAKPQKTQPKKPGLPIEPSPSQTRFPFRPHPSPLPSTGEGTVDGSSPAAKRQNPPPKNPASPSNHPRRKLVTPSALTLALSRVQERGQPLGCAKSLRIKPSPVNNILSFHLHLPFLITL